MSSALHENCGKIIFNTIRRLDRWNFRVTINKLVQKKHPTDMMWISRYLNSTGLFFTTFIDIVGIASYFFIAATLLLT